MAPLLKATKKLAAAESNRQEKSGGKKKFNSTFKSFGGIEKKKNSNNSKILKKMTKGPENLINSTVQSPHKEVKKLLKGSPSKRQNNVNNGNESSAQKKKALQNKNMKPVNTVSQSSSKTLHNTASFGDKEKKNKKSRVRETKLSEGSPSPKKRRSHRMSRRKRKKLLMQRLGGSKTSPINSFSVVPNEGKNVKKAARKSRIANIDSEVSDSDEEDLKEHTLQINNSERTLEESDMEDELSIENENEGMNLSVYDSTASENDDDEISLESHASGSDDSSLDDDNKIAGESNASNDNGSTKTKENRWKSMTGSKRNENRLTMESRRKNSSRLERDPDEISSEEELDAKVNIFSDSNVRENIKVGIELEMEAENSAEESDDDLDVDESGVDDENDVNDESDDKNYRKIDAIRTLKLMKKQKNKMNNDPAHVIVTKRHAVSPEEELGGNVDVPSDSDEGINIDDSEMEEEGTNSVESDDDELDINDESDEKMNVNQTQKLMINQKNNLNKDSVNMAASKQHAINLEKELIGSLNVKNVKHSKNDKERTFSDETNSVKTSKKQTVKESPTKVKKSSKSVLESDGQEQSRKNESQKKKSKLKDKKQQKTAPSVTKFVVFISKLPSTATEEDVKNHFKDVPSIIEVNLIKDSKTGKSLRRGTMELNDYVSYAKALSLNKSDMDGWTINVIPDRSMPRGASRGLVQMSVKDKAPSEYKLCVSQLPISLSWKKIRNYFRAQSSIKQFIFPPVSENKESAESQRTMILEFEDQESYEKILAMNGTLLDEQPISVEPLIPAAKKKRKADEVDAPKKKQKVEISAESAQPAEKESFTVHVGFIPLSVTSEALAKHFRQAGKVLECVVHETRPSRQHKTGFVVMADKNSYQNALALSRSTLEGQTITVHKFLKQAAKKKKRFVVFVGNIPFTTKEEDMRKHFKDIGNILDVRFPLNKENKPQGFAYVEVADQASYEKCLSLNHSFLNGRRINVQYSVSKGKSGNKESHSSSFKQKLFKLQTLSQNQNFGESQNSGRRRRSKPDQKKRAYFRSKRNEQS